MRMIGSAHSKGTCLLLILLFRCEEREEFPDGRGWVHTSGENLLFKFNHAQLNRRMRAKHLQ
jgi:hypothetical protein